MLRPDVADQAAGSVLAQFETDRAVVWLSGSIDAAVSKQLDQVSDAVLTRAPRLDIESARITFCDGVLARFLREVSHQVPVTIRRPSLLIRQVLCLYNLNGRVRLADLPPSELRQD